MVGFGSAGAHRARQHASEFGIALCAVIPFLAVFGEIQANGFDFFVDPEADRTKKQLMKGEEIRRLIGKVEQRGFTMVPLNLHFKGSYVKADIALAKGKADHDKRNTIKERDWEREKGRLMRHKVSGPAKG